MTASEAKKISDARPSESDIHSILEFFYERIQKAADLGYSSVIVRPDPGPPKTVRIVLGRLKADGFDVITVNGITLQYIQVSW